MSNKNPFFIISKPSFKKIITGLIFFLFITSPIWIEDYTFKFCEKKRAKGKVDNIIELHGDMGSEVEIKYRFTVNSETFKGITSVSYTSFIKTNLKVGDSICCIEYCPFFPKLVNRFDFYLYMHPMDTINKNGQKRKHK